MALYINGVLKPPVDAASLDGVTANLGTPGAPQDGYAVTYEVNTNELVLTAAGGGAPAGTGIVEAMGGKVVERNRSLRARTQAPTEDGISIGGEIIHEVGTTRMGTSPRTSVLNEWCQAHDARNVFVADAGPFVTNAHKNATWTILALAMRTAEHIADERKRGNL